MIGTFTFFPNFSTSLNLGLLWIFITFRIPFGFEVLLYHILSCFTSTKEEKKIFKISLFLNSENMKINSIFHIFSWGSKTKVRKVSDMFLGIYIDSFLLQFFQLILLFIEMFTSGFNFDFLFYFRFDFWLLVNDLIFVVKSHNVWNIQSLFL